MVVPGEFEGWQWFGILILFVEYEMNPMTSLELAILSQKLSSIKAMSHKFLVQELCFSSQNIYPELH